MNEDTRLALLEQTITHINLSLSEIKSDIKLFRNDLNQRVTKIETEINIKFEKLDVKIQKLEEKVNDNFRWTIGVVITLFTGLYATALGGMIARLCHWI